MIEPEWLDWYRKTPQERQLANYEAWANYVELGGSLDPVARAGFRLVSKMIGISIR